MAQNLNQSVHHFNQEALKKELTAALIIQNQLHALTEDMVVQYPSSKESKALQSKIHTAAEQAIEGMLHAETKEIFIAHQRRLDHLVAHLQKKLALWGDLDKALLEYRFTLQIQRLLHDMTIENKAEDQKLPEWFSKHQYYDSWKKKLEDLRGLSDAEAFDNYKKELQDNLMLMQSQQNLANLASLALIKQNSRTLSDIRFSYLPETNDRKEIFTDLAWIATGAVLVTVAAVLGFAFPALLIPGIVIGAAVLGYGAFDFARENVELLSELQGNEIGERVVAKDTAKELEALEHQIPGFEKGKFLERQGLQVKEWSTEKKIQRGLGYSIAFAGLALGVAGLLAVIPGVGIPLAGLIAITVLAATVCVLATALWGYKVAREQEKLNAEEKGVKEEMAADERMISEADLGLHKDSQLSSSAKIILHELDASKQNIENLEVLKINTEEDEFDDITEKSNPKAQPEEPTVVSEQPAGHGKDEGDEEGEGDKEGEGRLPTRIRN